MVRASRPGPVLVAFLGVGTVLILGALDYVTGPELGFFVFYFAPVILLAWYASYWFAIAMSFACAVTWLGVDLLSQHSYVHPAFRYWNTLIRLASFLMIAHFASEVRALLMAERELTVRLQETIATVRQLKGLLPICASCKRIRNDKGYWEQIEGYVRDRSEAEFSHSLCPECTRKLYPSIADDVLRDEPGNAGPQGDRAGEPEKG